jgi:AcrR family transcriptional regulator
MARKGDERRQSIIDTATEVLLEGGPGSLVLRDVAERLGITHGNLQYYFPTKNALLLSIFDGELEKFTEGIRSAVSGTSTKRGRLAAIIDSGIEELKSPSTALWRMMISMAEHSPEMAEILKKENDRYREVLAQELKQIAPSLSPQRRRHIARIVQAVLDGLAIQFIHENPDSAEMRALQSEIKAALVALVEAE